MLCAKNGLKLVMFFFLPTFAAAIRAIISGGIAERPKFYPQLGTLLGVCIALAGGAVIYGVLKQLVGIRLDPDQEFDDADLSIHKISATAERETSSQSG